MDCKCLHDLQYGIYSSFKRKTSSQYFIFKCIVKHINNYILYFILIKEDITNRADVEKLVHTFYDRIRINDEIGFYFNETIKDWDSHLIRLTDFWDTQLLKARNFRGNPLLAHIKVDQHFNHKITTKEFGEWLNIWFKTVDELYKGEIAETAKDRARRMSTHLFMNMYKYRNADT